MKIAINGFGRIGRLTLRALLEDSDLEVVAINDLASSSTLAHLFKYDSNYGPFKSEITCDASSITICGKRIHVYASADPHQLPWETLGIDIVLESTGRFLDTQGAGAHIASGAKHVIISAPAKEKTIPTVVFGINDAIVKTKPKIISNASCTTNCLAPVVKILDDHFGIEQGTVNTIHAYTADQSLQDAPHKDLRRARAAAVSIIPTSTGAAKAIGLIIPHLQGKLDGMAMRVPVANGSVIDFTAILKAHTTKEEVNKVMLEAAQGSFKQILAYTEDPIVSVDVIGNTHSAIFDANLTYIGGKLVKVVSWYDNEGGYAHRLVDVMKLFR
ncbi:type I glyceraldehyde-3-phosphate dehydrogenase [Cardinium endosymbiont of Culicoides punctatus]|uniref:type I glyceraldehyde-3-phosphate dehydrogenase n=1 Tax=Cardinium endosymbiont of Culicoides punctatus TaxID=2304601 RepID=UPI0010588CF3|nr:type I glyceraldehyde-3-phosphate dehydrogenase [Cardinium endosymbiont of Culicoides punctatus]TDG95114.1 Glyceraldehyde-3-phosphate dehydrogenase [Cardinium endosymbiont of Culicoides punctatus]